jgi:selenium-binding protein 1
VVREITADELAAKAGDSRPPTVHCGPGGSFVFNLGDAHQLVFEVRPAHDPETTWGCVGVVISVEDLSRSVWAWHRDRDRWAVRKVLTIPAEPADPDDLPPALQPLGAVPPLISDLDLSVDDRWLSVSCWGTGERNQDDVSDIFPPTRPARSAWAASSAATPTRPPPTSRWPGAADAGGQPGRPPGRWHQLAVGGLGRPLLPRRGRRLAAKLDTNPEHGGGLSPDPRCFPNGQAFGGLRVHQTRLQGGDAARDSYCHPR